MKASEPITASRILELVWQRGQPCGNSGQPEEDQNCTFVGNIDAFTEDMFQQGSPFFGSGDHIKLKLKTNFYDQTGRVRSVTFWTAALREITHTDMETMASMWEQCGDEYGKGQFLDMLNAHLDQRYTLICTIKLWNPNHRIFDVQVNVDNAERVVESS